MNKSFHLIFATLLCATWSMATLADEHHEHFDHGGGREHRVAPAHVSVSSPRVHMEMDAHFGHNRYYPRVGIGYRSLPGGYYTTHFHGSPYYFREGVWYRHGGIGYVVVRPPIGLFINVLPPFYTTLWFGGIPYYYADNIYYRWDPVQSGYIVSDPPPGSNADDTASAPPPSNDIFVYPKNGQSDEQKSTDRYECYRWAVDQSGFDPTKTAGGVNDSDIANKSDQYHRAEAACLEGRGYTVK